MFDIAVKLVLCYGSKIWGLRNVEKIEKVQAKFCKRYCCLGSNTADFLALGECGRLLAIAVTYMSRCLKYWIRLLQMEEYRYPKHCYIMLKKLDENGKLHGRVELKIYYLSLGLDMHGLHRMLETLNTSQIYY